MFNPEETSALTQDTPAWEHLGILLEELMEVAVRGEGSVLSAEAAAPKTQTRMKRKKTSPSFILEDFMLW